jgi:L-seryl-tRNA(Ser) seleniumtransferase
MDGMDLNARLRNLPKVDHIAAELEGPHALVVAAARRSIDEARGRVQAGEEPPSFEEVTEAARRLLQREGRSLLRSVINATGVLVHTNLGRVPLGEEQLRAVAEISSGYSNLEFDLNEGKRGSRYEHAATLINAVVGSEAALVVNNNAAAVLLTLAGLCEGREVIISRGELIEIGGEFRIPDVMKVSGTRLVEVGTTNRTHLADYERAITTDTAAIMKVHPSNYRVVGFTKSVPARDVGRLARGRGVCFIHDLGSGLVRGLDGSFEGEPAADLALEEGADLVTFSGDKLLGGPQAGVIAGRAELIEKLSRHPLLRALRVDKMTLAALEATLRLYLEGRTEEIPFWAMASTPLEDLERRARDLAAGLAERAPQAKVEAVPLAAVTGGGSLPGTEFGSWGLSVAHDTRSAADIERSLRYGDTPVIVRIEDDKVLLDLRTVPPDEDPTLSEALTTALVAS